MLRRTLFIVIVVAFFDYPILQFAINQVLSVFYISFLCRENLFEDKKRRLIEVGTEFLCLMAFIILQQFLRNDLKAPANDLLTYMFIAVMALIFILNITYLIIVVIETRKDKKRADERMKRLH